MAMIREINHVGIRVANMDASLRLYRDLLGGTVIRDTHSADGTKHIVYVQLALGVVELIGGDFPEDDHTGLDHVAFLLAQDTDIHTAISAVQDAGYTVMVKPTPTMAGDGYIAFFKDMANCKYELIQRKENTRIPDLKNERIKKFDHISIRVDNDSAENTRHLVQDVLGLAAGRTLEIGDNSWKSYCVNSDNIGLFDSKDKPRPENPLALLVFDVVDCFDLHKHLTKHDIKATDVRPSGIGDYNLFFAVGPDGENLEFLDR